ncbi:MAG: toprim domain-containing protein, partial [Patescibacteria group bacterium]
KRGLDEKTIRKFRLGYASRTISAKDLMLRKGVPAAELVKAGSPEKFFERVIFPIFDVMGHVIGFTGRTLGDSQPKYLNSPETPLFNKSRILYGLNFAKGAIKDSDAVVLVEGQFDVISLHHHGIENAVASSGTAITEQQLQILSKYTPNFLLAFDGDTAGINTTKKVIELLLAADLNARVINFGKFKDADELLLNDPPAWVIQQKAAKEAIDWLIDQAIAESGDIKQIEGKKKVLKAVLSIVKLIDDPTRLDHAAQRLASKLGLSLDSIYSSITRAKSPRQSGDSATNRPGKASLTNEEQLLAIFLSKPQLIKDFIDKLKNIVWLSVDARSIADVLENCYTNKALVTNQNQFLSQVKNQTNSQIAQKVDAWMFWLSDQWNNLTDPTAIELLEEKFRLLSNKSHENQKTQLAQSIKTAQEAGDVKEIKKLMNKLNELTKEA